MRSEVFYVKSLRDYLRDIIQPILKTPDSLKSARPFTNIKLIPREIVGAFLTCLVIRHISNQDWTIARDPEWGDGIIWCREKNRQNEAAFLEQVYVRLRSEGLNMEKIYSEVNQEIQKKINKGKNYSENKHLVVFLDAEGYLDYQNVKRFVDRINERFDSYWVFAPSSKKEFKYIVFLIKAERDLPSAYEVLIDNNFRNWLVKKLGNL